MSEAELQNLFLVFRTEWLDLLWLPFALILLHKGQRLKAAAFILACIFTLRLQIELFNVMGHAQGFTPFLNDFTLHQRGYAVYGFFILAFLLLSYFSPMTTRVIYFAAAISVYFMALLSAFAVLAI